MQNDEAGIREIDTRDVYCVVMPGALARLLCVRSRDLITFRSTLLCT